MTDTTGTGNPPEPQGAALLQKPGDFIRGKREAAGMTQAQVGEALHLTVHYIKSLENDEYGKLPGLTFVKGYFRAYARLLKLDETEVLECYDSYIRSLGLQESTQEQTLRVRRRNDQAILWAVAAGVILVVGLGAGWWFVGREDAAAPAVVATLPRSAAPAPVQTPAQTPVRSPAPVAPAPQFDAPPAAAEPVVAAPLEESAGATTTLMTEEGTVVLSGTLGVAAPAPVPASLQVSDTTLAAPLVAATVLQPAPIAIAPDAAAGAVAAPVDAEPVAAAAAGAAAAASTGVAAASGTNTRRVELVGAGADQLELQFSGNSWVEVDDAVRTRLYSDMMRSGDALSIKAAAPFHILLGDATGVAVLLNGQPLPIAASIRSDKTARIMISAEGVSAWAVE